MYIHGTWGKKCRYINETRLYLAFLGMAWVQIECYLVFSYLLTMKMDCWIFHLVFTRVFVKHAGIKGYISLWDADFSMEPLPKPVLVLSFLFDLFPWIKSPALYSSVWTDSLIKHLLSVRYFIRPAPDMNVHWKYQEAPWDYAQLESTRDFLPSDNFPWSEFAVGHRDLEEVLFLSFKCPRIQQWSFQKSVDALQSQYHRWLHVEKVFWRLEWGSLGNDLACWTMI